MLCYFLLAVAAELLLLPYSEYINQPEWLRKNCHYLVVHAVGFEVVVETMWATKVRLSGRRIKLRLNLEGIPVPNS